MIENSFAWSLIESAEQADRKMSPQRIAQLKDSYEFFLVSGLSEEDIKNAMSITDHEIRLLKNN